MTNSSYSDRRFVVISADAPGILRNFMLLLIGATIVAEAALLYRLVAQLMASIPESAPGVWVYQLGGVLVGPLSGFESSTARAEVVLLEFALFVAFEVYLFFGTLAVLACYAAYRLAARYLPNPWAVWIDVSPLLSRIDRLDAALGRLLAAADARAFRQGSRLWSRGESWLRPLLSGERQGLRHENQRGVAASSNLRGVAHVRPGLRAFEPHTLRRSARPR